MMKKSRKKKQGSSYGSSEDSDDSFEREDSRQTGLAQTLMAMESLNAWGENKIVVESCQTTGYGHSSELNIKLVTRNLKCSLTKTT
ncbi:unnamed protein product [Phytophthora lilii]|uniref:Unnamed protein product n=1 Tax=Phytophthora lilii TaxID=2077276 RepID=A0A9W6TG48_9STRA|nr:unnamed protein product [Phytophthora lilii]